MNSFERSEVTHYPEVWYLGLEANKIDGEEGADHNHGYDDDNGSYIKASTHSVWIYIFSLMGYYGSLFPDISH